MTDRGKIILGALVGFLVSGVAGFYFKDWASRARPEIHVVSLGFQGDDVEVSEEALKLSSAVDWGPTIQKFVSFDELLSYENELSRTEQLLTQAKAEVDRWLSDHPKSELQRQLKISEVLSAPFVGVANRGNDYTSIIGASINGELRRRGILQVPADLADVKELSAIFPIFRNESGQRTVHFGRESITFPESQNFGNKEALIQETIAEAFSRGHGPTIRWYHERFSQETAEDLNRIRSARLALQSELGRQAALSATVVLYNEGGKPFVVQPFFLGRIEFGDDEFSALFEIANSASSEVDGTIADLEALLGGKPNDTRGDLVEISDFLPREPTAKYVDVPPNSSVTVRLVSKKKIGDESADFLKFFDVGAVKLRVLGLTAKQVVVISEPSDFGREISAAKLKFLEEKAEGAFLE